MKFRRQFFLIIFLFITFNGFTVHAQQSSRVTSASGQDSATMNKFLSDLLGRMTLEEKIGQLNLLTGEQAITGSSVNKDAEGKILKGQVGGFLNIITVAKIRKAQEIAVTKTRLKIPLIFGLDVIHGYKTIFPIPLALSATWDPKLIEKTARIAAQEATADGINWTFSPMVDISRDPRWGRVAEGSGEDPYLGAEIAKAMVKGYQGDDLSKENTLLACVKHFALYGASESGRDYNTVDMGRSRMYNEYFLPYKAAIDAGAASVMASFNEVDGIPATANKWLLTDVLRKEWGFSGMLVTDYTGINEMIDHGLGGLQEVSAKALNAGIDMDMVGEGFITTLTNSLEEKKVSEKDIDRACRMVLEAKYKLGLFEDPYRYCNEQRAEKEIFTADHRAFARKVAGKSVVLLKNEKQTLPLKKSGTIALIGPLADSKANMVGTWSVSANLNTAVSLKEGLEQVGGSKVRILLAKGSNLMQDSAQQTRGTMFGRTIPRDDRNENEMIKEAVAVAMKADVIVAALGEASEMSGESASRTDINVPQVQQRLLEALLKTAKPLVLVLFNGRPLDLSWENEHVPSILNAWFGGTESGLAIADVLFGDVNPGGKITASFPRNVGQIPVYYNHKNTGRPQNDKHGFTKYRSNYLDASNEPLFPFGYGLSYTTFGITAPMVDKKVLSPGGTIKVKVDVKNTGTRLGEEVVQLYIRDMAGSITRPVKELKKFTKIALMPGESREISFTITEEDIKFYNADLAYVAEPGDFKIYVGNSAEQVKEVDFSYLKN
ncbi:beta-glucosidase [Pedobacter sp. BAL39]|uniref:beta-glucosidase BglX n=1 Tax=Pedobacter sp. BAL39 TaxID=391596 RepID=UPI0001559C0B|nr:beta-glucosidase BglX [Pedobacter sp. BAL39]EDM36279.1 beta-glucosidase [Pedobacter sp. BAL39]